MIIFQLFSAATGKSCFLLDSTQIEYARRHLGLLPCSEHDLQTILNHTRLHGNINLRDIGLVVIKMTAPAYFRYKTESGEIVKPLVSKEIMETCELIGLQENPDDPDWHIVVAEPKQTSLQKVCKLRHESLDEESE